MKRFVLAIALTSLVGSGCITRQVTDEVYSNGDIKVYLRGDKKSGKYISQGYEHPAIISPLRIARVLAALEVESSRDKERERSGIMPYSLYQPVSRGVAQALEQAGPGQEVVVMAVIKRMRLGIFHRKYLTSFVSYVKEDELVVHLARVNWEIPKNREDKLPTPRVGEHVMPFRVAPVRGMRRLGPQSIAARWRDPAFGKTAGVRRPDDLDKIKKRTILMGDDGIPAGERPVGVSQEQLEGLTQKQRDALAELDRRREAGTMTEDEYLRSRDDLLLDEF